MRLEPITADNFEEALAIRLRPVSGSLSGAYVHGEKAWPWLVLDGETAVGFELMDELAGEERVALLTLSWVVLGA